MRIIDVHGAHLLDFERYQLETGNIDESRRLGYSVLECSNDIAEFLGFNPDNITTVLPPLSPLFGHNGKFDMDFLPFAYENTQILQLMTFISKLGLEKRVFPYYGFSVHDKRTKYFEYLKKLTDKINCGFKMHPISVQTKISELRGSKFMDFASEHKTPMLIHTGRDEYSDSRMLLNLSENYPDVNFCAAHFGSFRREFLEGISDTPNLFLDTSIVSALLNEVHEGNEKHVQLEIFPAEIRAESPGAILSWIVEKYNIEEKILFGTDNKWVYRANSDRKKEIEFIENLEYPKDKKDKWMYSNALNFLKISRNI